MEPGSRKSVGVVARYGGAVFVTAAAYALQVSVWRYIPPSPTLLFFPAVFLAAWYGGFWPGALSTVLSTAGIAYGFLPGVGSLAIDAADDILDLGIFAVVSFGMAFLIERLATARHRAELADARKDEILEVVSHDLKAPLGAILLGVDAIARDITRGETARALAMTPPIRRSAMTADRLVRQILDLAKIDAETFEVAKEVQSLEPVLRQVCDVLSPLADAKAIALTAEVHASHTPHFDILRVQQVLQNLVANAIKFAPHGGHVQVTIEDAEGSGVRVLVEDDGPGLAPDDLPHVFDRHWRRQPSTGSGLGLFIARAIIQAHGGAIAAGNRPGGGAQFAFTLP